MTFLESTSHSARHTGRRYVRVAQNSSRTPSRLQAYPQSCRMSTVMKRLILLIIISLLPLQASWAVANAYCPPTSIGYVDDRSFNLQETKAPSYDEVKKADTSSEMSGHSDYACHASCAFLSSSSHYPPPPLASDSGPDLRQDAMKQRALNERPERPQWLPLA